MSSRAVWSLLARLNHRPTASVENAPSDAELIARYLRNSDAAAFELIVWRHGGLVLSTCRRILRDHHTSEDAFQATFLILAKKAGSVRPQAPLAGWLHAVARRVCLRLKKRVAFATEATLERAAPESSDPLHIAEWKAILECEIARLPEKLRLAVVLCYLQGRTAEETGALLRIPRGTVLSRLDLARKKLKARLTLRGVAPASATGLLLTGWGTQLSACPELVENTVLVVFDFLAGGTAMTSAPAILANGVAMNGLRMKLTVSAAVVVLGFSAIGLGLAGNEPQAEARKIPPQYLPLVVAPKEMQAKDDKNALFAVSGGDALVNRVVQREAEFVAKELAQRWIGKPLPALKTPYKIAVKIDSKSTASTTFTFSSDSPTKLLTSEMQLTGTLEQILREQLPHEITHCLLAAHFGKAIPRWADEGIALLNEPANQQAQHDNKCRELLNSGKAISLKNLLTLTEYPTDMGVLYAQGHSVARFLHEKDANKLLPLIAASFTGGWDKALKATYGFNDADALQTAWLAWMRLPGSFLTVAKSAQSTLEEYFYVVSDIRNEDNQKLGGEVIQRVAYADALTVLDAIKLIGGLSDEQKLNVWIERPTSGNKPQILPVDWKDIVENGITRTNYQILPGDRLHVVRK